MAAINFPTSPSLNQYYTNGAYTWRWNGASWDFMSYGRTFSEEVMSNDPVFWARCNTASGTENTLGRLNLALTFGADGIRSSTNGPAGGGYYTGVASNGASYVEVPTNLLWSAFTVMTFIKLPLTGNGQAGHNPTIISRGSFYAIATNAFPFFVRLDNANTRFFAQLDSGNDFNADQVVWPPNNTAPLDQWAHLAVVVRPSGSPVDIVVNGEIVYSALATTTMAASQYNHNWRLGASIEYSGGAGLTECLGNFSEFMAFDYPLPIKSIRNIYNARGRY